MVVVAVVEWLYYSKRIIVVGWADLSFFDFRRKMCIFVSRPMKIVTFLRNDYTTKRVDFPRERDTSRKKIMEIVEDFDEKSYNNNGKPWKSSTILRVNPNFFIFLSFFFIFLHFRFFNFFHFFMSLHFSISFFHFFQFFIFLHFLSFSFMFVHFRSFSIIFFHFPSFSFIFFHVLSCSFMF